jgi:hypothetical protein
MNAYFAWVLAAGAARDEEAIEVVFPPVLELRDQRKGCDRSEQCEKGNHRPQRRSRHRLAVIMAAMVRGSLVGAGVFVGGMIRGIWLAFGMVIAGVIIRRMRVGSMMAHRLGDDQVASLLRVAEDRRDPVETEGDDHGTGGGIGCAHAVIVTPAAACRAVVAVENPRG